MNPHRRATSTQTEGECLSHASRELPALNPAASHNPLSASEPWNLAAEGYAETTMLVFEQFADVAIAASKLKPNSTVLEVAGGPGTLALRLAQHAEQVHGIDFSEPMLAVFCGKIEQAGHHNIALHCGDAQTLPYTDATFDAAFSLFGLMFFPDSLLAFPTGSIGEFWGFMVKGSAPIQMMKKGLGEAQWREKVKLALVWLEETLPTLKRLLTSDAWLGVGVK